MQLRTQMTRLAKKWESEERLFIIFRDETIPLRLPARISSNICHIRIVNHFQGSTLQEDCIFLGQFTAFGPIQGLPFFRRMYLLGQFWLEDFIVQVSLNKIWVTLNVTWKLNDEVMTSAAALFAPLFIHDSMCLFHLSSDDKHHLSFIFMIQSFFECQPFIQSERSASKYLHTFFNANQRKATKCCHLWSSPNAAHSLAPLEFQWWLILQSKIDDCSDDGSFFMVEQNSLVFWYHRQGAPHEFCSNHSRRLLRHLKFWLRSMNCSLRGWSSSELVAGGISFSRKSAEMYSAYKSASKLITKWRWNYFSCYHPSESRMFWSSAEQDDFWSISRNWFITFSYYLSHHSSRKIQRW